MPAKPLTPEQAADAARLRAAWSRVKAATGKTQTDLAFDLGFATQSAVSQYLQGRIPLNIEALKNFAAALDVPMRQISPSLCDRFESIAGPGATTNRRVTAVHESTAPSSIGPWPLSEAVLERLRKLKPDQRAHIENIVRASLKMNLVLAEVPAGASRKRATA